MCTYVRWLSPSTLLKAGLLFIETYARVAGPLASGILRSLPLSSCYWVSEICQQVEAIDAFIHVKVDERTHSTGLYSHFCMGAVMNSTLCMQGGRRQTCATVSALCRLWGSKLRPSCSCNKYFTHGAIPRSIDLQ